MRVFLNLALIMMHAELHPPPPPPPPPPSINPTLPPYPSPNKMTQACHKMTPHKPEPFHTKTAINSSEDTSQIQNKKNIVTVHSFSAMNRTLTNTHTKLNKQRHPYKLSKHQIVVLSHLQAFLTFVCQNMQTVTLTENQGNSGL